MRLYEIEPIGLNVVKNYKNEVIDRKLLEQELTEIIRILPQAFSINIANDIFKKANKMTNIKIDELQMYGYESLIELIIILYNENKKQIAAIAGFERAPHIRAHLWQAKNAQVYPPYEGNALVGKIYKFAKERLNMSIQSDFQQTAAGEKLWTSTLPKLGLQPKIVDLTDYRVYDNNGAIDVYSKENEKRYCWIIEYDDYYRNQMMEGSLLMPYNGYYLINDKNQYNSPIY